MVPLLTLRKRWCAEHFPRFWRKVEWSGNSPDLNPIENLCSILKDRLKNGECSKLEDLILQVKSVHYVNTIIVYTLLVYTQIIMSINRIRIEIHIRLS